MQDWIQSTIDDACIVEYGTRVTRKRDSGTIYPVYGGGGATFQIDSHNREERMIISRFAMSEKCTRFVEGKFFLNDSGLTLRPKDENVLLPKFLDWLIHSLNNKIYNLGRGTAQRNLNLSEFRKLIIQYPNNLDEQQKIINILNGLSESIVDSVNQSQLNLLNSEKLFESFFSNILDPFSTSEPQHVLSDLCELIVDSEHKTAPTQDTGHPMIRTPNVGMGDLQLNDVRRVSYENYAQWTRRAIPLPADLILTREAPAGKVGVIPDGEMVCLGQRTVLIRPKSEIFNSKFLAFLLHHPRLQKKLLSHSKGATVSHVNMRDIRALGIGSIPSIAIQEDIVRQIITFKKSCENLRNIVLKKLDSLVEFKQSIMLEACSGKVAGGSAG
jgi:type I restriction enzyme, S subunit